MTDKIDADKLEHMIDRFGLSAVLDTIADIAHGKAEHIECNWQDSITARLWRKAARRVELANKTIVRLLG